MSKVVNILAARNGLSALVARVEAGEEIVIARRGRPVARLVPVDVAAPRTGTAIVEWLESHPVVVAAERSRSEVDAGLAAEREAWE